MSRLDKHVVGLATELTLVSKQLLQHQPLQIPLLVVTHVGEYRDCGRQRSKKGDLVAVRSFPKTSWP